MGDVITNSKFVNRERMDELKAQGLVVVDETRDWADLDLKEPQYGEEILGPLDGEEKALFFMLYDTQQQLEDRTRTLMGNQIARVGTTIRDSDRNKSLPEALQDAEMSFENDDEAVEYFRLEKLAKMLHSTFHWQVAERLNAHAHVLGVRTQGRVVKVEKRY